MECIINLNTYFFLPLNRTSQWYFFMFLHCFQGHLKDLENKTQFLVVLFPEKNAISYLKFFSLPKHG